MSEKIWKQMHQAKVLSQASGFLRKPSGPPPVPAMEFESNNGPHCGER